MKHKRKIQWAQAINEQPYSEKVLAENDMSGIWDSLLCVIFAFICMFSGILAITDVYEVEKPGIMWTVGVILILSVMSIVGDALSETDYPWAKYVSSGMLGIGIVGFGVYLLIDGGAAKVLGGIVAFLRLYFRQWSSYYDVAVSWYSGDERYIKDGVYFMVFMMFFVAVWVARLIKKKDFMILFPVLIMGAELLVGKFPGKWAVLLLLAGILLNQGSGWSKPDMQAVSLSRQNSEGRERSFAWIGTSIIIVVVCGVILLVGTKPAEALMERNKERELPKIKDMIQAVVEWEGWENHKISRELANTLATLFEEDDTEEITNNTPIYAHVPVLKIEVEEMPQEDIYIKGFVGVCYENGVWEAEDFITGQMYPAEAQIIKLSETDEREYVSYSPEGYISLNPEEALSQEETCLAVPEKLVEVKAVAAELDRKATEYAVDMSEGQICLKKAEMVDAWMKNHTAYSLELPNLPAGTDPIEYFIGTTRTGYCMHYASASVMILREMGVPTRFVSGYLVDFRSFEKTSEGYEAVVLDDRAHAWVEIYLPEKGWIPIDVTPAAFMEEEQVTIGDGAGSPDVRPNATVIGTEGTGQKIAVPGVYGPTQEMEEPSESDSEESVPTYGPNVIPKDSEEQEEEKESVHWFVVAIIISLAVLAGTTFMVAANTHKFFTLESRYYKQIKKEMRNGNHKACIKKINKAVCRKLQFKKLLQPGNSDEEYENVLKTKYSNLAPEDRERYMNIVKAAAFSEREFTEDEAKFCYEVYRDIIYKDEVW